MLLATLLSLWQRLTKWGNVSQDPKQEVFETDRQNKLWDLFASGNRFSIERDVAGSLPWDSGYYLHLRSDPKISFLTGKLFGNWVLVEFDGVFLQRWNHTRIINCDLVFVDFNSLKVTELKKGVPTKNWTSEKINADEIKFTFSTSKGDLIYEAKRSELNQKDSG